MRERGYWIVGDERAKAFKRLGIKMLKGPGIILSEPLIYWAPKAVILAYEQRDESAHTKAEWMAVLINPEYVTAPATRVRL